MSEQMNEGAGLYCEECRIEGRNPVIEAFRAGRTVDKLYVLDGCQDGPVKTILREAKKTVIQDLFCGKGAA